MEVSSFIQENNQDRICKFCERNILGQSSCSSTFMCEGRWCEQANEEYYEEYPEEAERMPEFIYKPSQDVKILEEKLDNRIKLLHKHSFLSGLMLLRSSFYWGGMMEGLDVIEPLRNHLYKVINKAILEMVNVRCEIMKAGGSVEEILNYPEMKANFKIQSEWKKLQEDKAKDCGMQTKAHFSKFY